MFEGEWGGGGHCQRRDRKRLIPFLQVTRTNTDLKLDARFLCNYLYRKPRQFQEVTLYCIHDHITEFYENRWNGFSPEDGEGTFLRNAGIYLRVYTTSQPRASVIFTIVRTSSCLTQHVYRVPSWNWNKNVLQSCVSSWTLTGSFVD
jgi:hypothetical protein